MDTQVRDLQSEAEAALGQVHDPAALAEWKARYLGDKGALTGLLRGIGALPKEARPAAGQFPALVRLRLGLAAVALPAVRFALPPFPRVPLTRLDNQPANRRQRFLSFRNGRDRKAERKSLRSSRF